MNVYRIAPRAQGDLDEIWDYVAAHSFRAADRLIDSFHRRFQALAQHPFMGRERSELGANLRSYARGNYVVFYRPIAAGVEIARVVHGARDLGRLVDE